MTITREQVADLRAGDVVELTDERWPDGSVLRGPAYFDDGELRVGHLAIATRRDGRLYLDRPRTSLRVISRAPRPLYVNHPRTEPVPGDIVRDADSDDPQTWYRAAYDFGEPWYPTDNSKNTFPRVGLPTHLRLLVDGDTGQVVP